MKAPLIQARLMPVLLEYRADNTIDAQYQVSTWNDRVRNWFKKVCR